jgi:uncharacterized protein (TIGR03083 family)
MTTIVRAHDVARTDHAHAGAVLRPEVDAMHKLLRALATSEWLLPTECAGWKVRDIVAHVIGNAEVTLDSDLMAQRISEGTTRYPELYRLDAMNERAVDAWRDRDATELVAEFARLWQRVLEVLPEMPESAREQTFDTGYPGASPISLGYIVDVVLARDLWMHRVDICRASGRAFPSHDHDRAVVEQVLRDLDDSWAAPPIVLELTGVVTGDWQIGTDGPVATVQGDTLEVMRNLSGRTDPEPELTVQRGDPTVLNELRAARVPF